MKLEDKRKVKNKIWKRKVKRVLKTGETKFIQSIISKTPLTVLKKRQKSKLLSKVMRAESKL